MFYRENPESEHQLKAWYSEATKAGWKTPHDIKREYPKASIVGEKTVVFNICHNNYRLAVNIEYKRGWIFIVFVGNHKEYDRWNRTR